MSYTVHRQKQDLTLEEVLRCYLLSDARDMLDKEKAGLIVNEYDEVVEVKSLTFRI